MSEVAERIAEQQAKSFRRELRRRRLLVLRRNGWTQRQIAERMGVSHGRVAQLERLALRVERYQQQYAIQRLTALVRGFNYAVTKGDAFS